MKNTFVALAAVVVCVHIAPEMSAQVDPRTIGPVIVERGAHYNVWQYLGTATNALTGEILSQPRTFTEMATGINYQDESGQWQPTREEFTLTAEGAVGRFGQHKVVLANNINSSGAVDLLTPDNVRFRNHPLAIGYFDAQSGQRITLAVVQDSVGELLASNKVIYRDAYAGLSASVLYTYSMAGLEADVVLHEASRPPQAYGLSDQYSRLEVVGELLLDGYVPNQQQHVLRKESDAALRATMAQPDFIDTTLHFGDMRIGPSHAFQTEDGQPVGLTELPVGKSVHTNEGRTIVVEATEYPLIKPLLDRMPQTTASIPAQRSDEVASRNIPPTPAAKSSAMPMRLARGPLTGKSLVIDWVLLTTQNNFTFRSDTTYYVNSLVNLGGSTVIEGGTVVKYTNSTANPRININDAVNCLATSYQPSVFTSKDDNSIGELIPGSVGNPLPPAGQRYGNPALFFGSAVYGVLKNLRVAYAQKAVEVYPNPDFALDFWHCQFVHCNQGFQFDGDRELALRNILMYDLATGFGGSGASGKCNVQHLTANQITSALIQASSMVYTFMNSAFANITSWGGSLSGSFNGFFIGTVPSTFGSSVIESFSDPFDTSPSAGSAKHYLGTSDFRNVGTFSIDATLKVELKRKTTGAPTDFTGTISQNFCFPPRVQRDYDKLDLGYHYEPIDWVVNNLQFDYLSLTLKPGVVVATRGSYGFILGVGSQLITVGSPVNPNRIVRYNAVQEQADSTWASSSWWSTIAPPWSNVSPPPKLFARHTDWPITAGGYHHIYGSTLGNYDYTDCQFRGGNFYLGSLSLGTAGNTVTLTNNLFERVATTLEKGSDALTVTARNNLFKDGLITLQNATTAFDFKDNLFDKPTIAQYGTVTGNYNGYRSGYSRLSPNGANDVVLTALIYSPGPLGSYYFASSTPTLENAGSRLATAANLSHHTTKTSQVQEGSTQVDIGLHYAPVMGISEIPKSSMSLSSNPITDPAALASAKDDQLNNSWSVTLDAVPCEQTPTGWLQIDLGAQYGVTRFAYHADPVLLGGNGTIFDYEIYVTNDPMSWGSPVATGSWAWSNRPQNEAAETKVVQFAQTNGRYVILKCLKGKSDAMRVNEFWVYKADSSSKVYVPVDTDNNNRDDYLEDWNNTLSVSLPGTVSIVDSNNDASCCPGGGACSSLTQKVRASTQASGGSAGVDYLFSASVTGKVEQRNNFVDIVSVVTDDNCLEPTESTNPPFENTFWFFEGNNCALDCTEMLEKTQTKKVGIRSGETLFLQYDTFDPLWHKGAFATMNSVVLVGVRQPSLP